jgi:EmrB/QacA subfamily drug resistance transporter
LSLIVISIAQLMVTLDSTIVNVALPSAQADIGFSDANRQWIVTAYGVAFGGLLLTGGRLGDMVGRKRLLIVGLIGFGLASTLGGLAPGVGTIVAARALQGVCAAMLAPAALSLLSLTFVTPRERATAFGVFSAVSGAGGAIGLLLGGLLTELVSWRWTLLVNLLFAAVAASGALAFVRVPEPERTRLRIDVPGVVLGFVGIASLVYGFSAADENGWTSAATLAPFCVAIVMLAAFVVVESRASAPLLPLRVVMNRQRGGAFLALALATMGLSAPFLLMTFYLQRTLHFTPVQTGLAFLPLTLAAVIGATQIGTRLTRLVAPRPHVAVSLLVAACGVGLLAQIRSDSSYWLVVFPGFVILGVGLGCANMRLLSVGSQTSDSGDAGIASAMVGTSQQIGAAVGTAALSAIAAQVAAAMATSGVAATNEDVAGYGVALYVAAGLFVAGTVIAILTLGHRRRVR